MLALFFSELSSLAKYATYATFTIIPFDTSVAEDQVWEWKKGKKYTWERVLTGGTDFNPPTEYVNARDFDAHLILTDMEAPKPKPSKVQRAWVTTAEHADLRPMRELLWYSPDGGEGAQAPIFPRYIIYFQLFS
jgi:predicted metal-dependent peptidase